jgi:hypothetical protein
MSLRIRKEEYSPLGDFIGISFVRDQVRIMVRYPKLNSVFLSGFDSAREAVKVLESGLVLTDEQKAVTKRLYAEAGLLNSELSFLNSYIADAELSSAAVTALKKDLNNNNIEGAVLKIEGVKQYVMAHLAALVAEGMEATFPASLDAHKVSISASNALQNSFMNNRKRLTDANVAQYKALYVYISKIAKAGKLVFNNTVIKDEYNISKIVKRMRAAAHHAVVPPVV